MTGDRGPGAWYGAGVVARLLLCGVVGAVPAWAQDTAPSPPAAVGRASRVELSALGGMFGGTDLGRVPANMLGNQVPTSGQVTLFTTWTTVHAAPAVEGRLGVRVWRQLWVEGGGSYARPDFAVAISGDTEGATDVTAVSRLTQVTADVSVQYRWQGRLAPYAFVGGGVLRQLDQPRTTAENGSMYYGGAGLRWRIAPASRGFMRRLAIRGEGRIVMADGGITLAEGRDATFSAFAGLAVGL